MDVKHGGCLIDAAREYQRPVAQWLDLSTGISPWAWPVPAVPEHVWRQLPEEADELVAAAARYYHCSECAVVPVAGSQAAIQTLPGLVARGTVAVPHPGYAEHHRAFQRLGHKLVYYRDLATLEQLVAEASVTHAVVINPNNPTTLRCAQSRLLEILEQLRSRDGYLFVDEAFADYDDENELASSCPQPGLVVYRSLGKFFGLAGLRLGFTLAEPAIANALKSAIGPWGVSGPARWVGRHALLDEAWQSEQRQRIACSSGRWLDVLSESMPMLAFGSAGLFVTGVGEQHACERIHEALAQRGILTRRFEPMGQESLLRFGLPGTDDFETLEEVLPVVAAQCG